MTYKKALLKLTVRQLRARRARLARQLPDVEGTVRGALQRQMRRCGKAGCRCAEGALHGPYKYLSVLSGVRSGLLSVPAEVVEEVKRRVETTGQIDAALAEISAINRVLLGRGE